MAMETDEPHVVESVLGKEHVSVATAISDALKFDRKMFMHALDLMATDFGCRDFGEFREKSRKVGQSQLFWHQIRTYGSLLIVGTVIMFVIWAISLLF